MIVLPEEVKTALDRLNASGFEAYAVGGCVRDSLLSLPVRDYDISTSALPEETKAVFSDCRLVETGIRHGTVTVWLGGSPLEITSYRVDGLYSDGRRPDSVSFTRSLREDAARRDFTVNAMYYAPKEGLIDPFGGQEDLNKRIIRAVGEPIKRFHEDGLRILRALRFSSVYGFAIESETESALRESKELLQSISAERLQAELLKLLGGKDVRRVLTSYADVLAVFLPDLLPLRGFEQKNKYHIHDVLTHTAVVVENVENKPSLLLAALFHDIGKPACFSVDKKGFGHFYGHAEKSVAIAETLLDRLKISGAVRQEVLTLIRCHDIRFPAQRKTVKKWMAKLTPALFFDLIKLKKGDLLGQSPAYIGEMAELNRMEELASDVLAKQECLSLSSLAINGSDLLSLGFSQGKEVGSTLNQLLERVLDGSLPNEKDDLLREAESLRRR